MKPSKIGKKIKYYREENSLTQQELADKIGVTWEMVSRYERGINEPYSRIKDIAKALNVDLNELLQNNNNASTGNYIPLFTNYVENFDPDATTFYYTCPQWILAKDKMAFAIDMGITDTNEKGVFYISPRTKPSANDTVIFKKSNKIIVGNFSNQKELIGTVLAKEVKLI